MGCVACHVARSDGGFKKETPQDAEIHVKQLRVPAKRVVVPAFSRIHLEMVSGDVDFGMGPGSRPGRHREGAILKS